jgi:hypothetical protein
MQTKSYVTSEKQKAQCKNIRREDVKGMWQERGSRQSFKGGLKVISLYSKSCRFGCFFIGS